MPRHYEIDQRVGCIAVRDTRVPRDSNGLHPDSAGVVQYWHGRYSSKSGWTVSDESTAEAVALRDKLNQESAMNYIPLANGTVWPHPRPMTGQGKSIEWLMRHTEAPLTEKQRTKVANILQAYNTLITHPALTQRRVGEIVGQIRKKLKEDSENGRQG